MKCPVCTAVNLNMSDRQGVEIDYCPQCRGVWLDRGELDKLIERAQAAPQAMQAPVPQYSQPQQHHQAVQQQQHPQHQQRGYDDRHRYSKDYYPRKKKSFLGEIFDFD